jgi:hypothetical protein
MQETNLILTNIQSRIDKYRDYDTDEELYLFYYYCGAKNVLQNGYSYDFISPFKEEVERSSVDAYLRGYMDYS